MYDENEKGMDTYEAKLSNKERMEIMGKCIEMARKSNKLTQKQVANMLEMPQQTYGSYETGRNAPSIETLVRLSFLFEINIEELVGKYKKVSKNYDKIKEMEPAIKLEQLKQQVSRFRLKIAEFEEEQGKSLTIEDTEEMNRP